MIPLELQRANIRKGIPAQHSGGIYILKQILISVEGIEIMKNVDFHSLLSLKKYYAYSNGIKEILL